MSYRWGTGLDICMGGVGQGGREACLHAFMSHTIVTACATHRTLRKRPFTTDTDGRVWRTGSRAAKQLRDPRSRIAVRQLEETQTLVPPTRPPTDHTLALPLRHHLLMGEHKQAGKQKRHTEAASTLKAATQLRVVGAVGLANGQESDQTDMLQAHPLRPKIPLLHQTRLTAEARGRTLRHDTAKLPRIPRRPPKRPLRMCPWSGGLGGVMRRASRLP